MVNHSQDQPIHLTILPHSCLKLGLTRTAELRSWVLSWKPIWSQQQSRLLTEIKELNQGPHRTKGTDLSRCSSLASA